MIFSYINPKYTLRLMNKGDRQKQGHVYILINQSYAGLLKIGMTTRNPEERAKELSRPTGIATPFFVAYQQEVSNCELVEQEIHANLSNFRYRNNREFFEMPLHEAVRMIPQIIDKIEIRLRIKGALPILDSCYCYEDQKYFIQNFVLSARKYIADIDIIHSLSIKLIKLYFNHSFILEDLRVRSVRSQEPYFINTSETYLIPPSDITFPSLGRATQEWVNVCKEIPFENINLDGEKKALELIEKAIASITDDVSEFDYADRIIGVSIEDILTRGNRENLIDLLNFIIYFISYYFTKIDTDHHNFIFYQNPEIEVLLSNIANENKNIEATYLALFCLYALYGIKWNYFQNENYEKRFLDFMTWDESDAKRETIATYATRFFSILSQFDQQSIDDIFRIVYIGKYERCASIDDDLLVDILNEMSHVNEYTGENDEMIGFQWCHDEGTKAMIVDVLVKLKNYFDENTLAIYLKSLL